MKRRIEPLYGVHHYGNRQDIDEASRTAASPLTDEQKAKMPLITHRIARPHPVTGRKALYAVSGSSFGIVGMPDDEARRPARRAGRARDTAEDTSCASSTASATSWSGTTPRCCIPRR